MDLDGYVRHVVTLAHDMVKGDTGQSVLKTEIMTVVNEYSAWVETQFDSAVSAADVAREIHGRVLAKRVYARNMNRRRAGGVAVPRPGLADPERPREHTHAERNLLATPDHVRRYVASRNASGIQQPLGSAPTGVAPVKWVVGGRRAPPAQAWAAAPARR
jgi:hypothetical protein